MLKEGGPALQHLHLLFFPFRRNYTKKNKASGFCLVNHSSVLRGQKAIRAGTGKRAGLLSRAPPVTDPDRYLERAPA